MQTMKAMMKRDASEGSVGPRLDLDYQVALDARQASDNGVPSTEDVTAWVAAVLAKVEQPTGHQLTVRIVDEQEITRLNGTYRDKQALTNVLSFPFQPPPGVTFPLLGDVVICAPVVNSEAKVQKKTVQQHWAHMVVHGTLHLLGFDHITNAEADDMETMEKEILLEFGISDPYTTIEPI